MRKKNRLMKYALYCFLVCIGILIGIIIRHYTNIPLAETIDIIDVAALLITVFLAIYIPEVLDHKLQIQRDKKALIENRITEFQALQRRINLLVQEDNAMSEKNYRTLKNVLDVSGNKIETIFTLIRYASFGTLFEKEMAGIRALCKEHRELLFINHETEDGCFYSDEIQQKEEELFNEIDKASSLLLFKISDAE